MRQVTQQVVGAFNYGTKKRVGNTKSTGDELYLHGNLIARKHDGVIEITNAGWTSNVTKERLNGIRGVYVVQKDFEWYLNGEKWDGSWTKLEAKEAGKTWHYVTREEPEQDHGLKTIAMVAKLGDIFGETQKQKNDWKARMLKAGLENSGLIIPDDWDQLDEDTKQARLDGAIGELAK